MAEKSKYRSYQLAYDSFGKPKILRDEKAIELQLVQLILLEPGTNPLFPEMGVGLVSKYRYLGQDQEDKLKKDIAYQINTYLPDARCTNVTLLYDPTDKSIDIEITVNGNIFVYDSSNIEPITLDDMKR